MPLITAGSCGGSVSASGGSIVIDSTEALAYFAKWQPANAPLSVNHQVESG
ncbi:hypothetical protein [Klebsiella pneumoniae]|uniref:hypothetical protein n=1 Tax=Klebsiella pneumoniae TaxID=573 RepID=UPI00210AC220|nr:hypothetical protein [Klebsiella pneumoniae]